MQPWPCRREHDAQENCAQREDDERDRHQTRALVRVLRCSARVPEKNVDDLPGHIESRENDTSKHQVMRCPRWRPMAYSVKNFLFRPAAGEKERDAAERHHSDCIGHKRNWHEPPQATHLANVLFAVTSVNDRAGAKE